MTSLGDAIASATIKSLSKNLSVAVHQKYSNIETATFQKFLNDFLGAQFSTEQVQEKQSKKKTVTKKEPVKTSKKKDLLVHFDHSFKKWMVEGTQFYVKGPKDRKILGKMLGDKEFPLSEGDKSQCDKWGWSY